MRVTIIVSVLIVLFGVTFVVAKETVQPLPNDLLTQTSDSQFLLAELSARGEVNIQTNNKTEYNETDIQLAELSAQGNVNIVLDNIASLARHCSFALQELSAQGWVMIVACGGEPTE